MVRWHCSVSGNLGGFLTSYILPHPFTGGFRRQYQRPAVMNIDQPLIGRSGDNQNPSASSPRSKGTLPIVAMKMGLPSLR